MNFVNIFKPRQKGSEDLVKSLRNDIKNLSKSGKDKTKTEESISKNLIQMKTILTDEESQYQKQELVSEILRHNADKQEGSLLQMLVDRRNMTRFEFESRKEVGLLFTALLKNSTKPGDARGTWGAVAYLEEQEKTLTDMILGYEEPEIALNFGLLLRDCLRHEPLAKIILYSPMFSKLFTFVESNTFDIASDAFASFKEALTKHKQMVSEYLDTHYDEFFKNYTSLLKSDNYVTKRQSLKLLGEILLDRSNFQVMTRYISDADNLKLMMNLLRDRSRNIQFEAFHVFKIFVANPNKNKSILDILVKNQERLVEFLNKFHEDRQDDEQFNDEKAFLIKQIRELKPHPEEY